MPFRDAPQLPRSDDEDPTLDWIVWEPAPGATHRPLTKREVQDLERHAAAITAAEELLPGLTRLADLHANWDAQHPVFQAALTRRRLHPGAQA